jgi:hypothetical protein
MGGLALVVAARGGEDARQDGTTGDDAAQSDVVAGEDTTGLASGLNELVGGRAIRLLDFAEVDQRGSACADALPDAPGTIRVTEGQSRMLDEDLLVRLEVEDNAIYGNLDGDAADEAVVRTVCAYGANGTQDQIQIWDLQAGASAPVATLNDAPEDISEGLPPTVKNVAVDQGAVVVTWQHSSEDAPRCCPDLETTARYELSDGDLTQVGEARTTQIG